MQEIIKKKLPHKAFFRFDKKEWINVPYFKIVIRLKERNARIRIKPRWQLMSVIFSKLVDMLKQEGCNDIQAATRARQSLLDFYRACDALSNAKWQEQASFPFDIRMYPYTIHNDADDNDDAHHCL